MATYPMSVTMTVRSRRSGSLSAAARRAMGAISQSKSRSNAIDVGAIRSGTLDHPYTRRGPPNSARHDDASGRRRRPGVLRLSSSLAASLHVRIESRCLDDVQTEARLTRERVSEMLRRVEHRREAAIDHMPLLEVRVRDDLD